MGIRMKAHHWLLLALLTVFVADRLIQAPDSRSRALNDALEARASADLRTYPYKFHVIRMQGEVAYLSTPRNVDVPAFRALAALYPDVDTKNPNNPAFIALEQRLGAVQAEARSIVAAQPGVKDVRWELDRDWLVAHYIEVPAK